MHANPSTAHPCAPTTPRKDIIRKLMAMCDQLTLSQMLKIEAVIDAVLFHESEGIEARLADPATCTDERAILLPVLEQISRELDRASFKPLFTKQQVTNIEATAKQSRNARRRIALSVLCMTEKRMRSIAKDNPDTFLDLIENCDSFVDDSRTQLELAEAARARLLLVGGEFIGVEA